VCFLLLLFNITQFSGASAEVLRQKVVEYTSTTDAPTAIADTSNSTATTATATDTARAAPAAADSSSSTSGNAATEHQPLQSADANEEL
jgi:hypothetical protein